MALLASATCRWLPVYLLAFSATGLPGARSHPAVLGHPALGIVWLANRLAEHGEGLAAGEIVLCGSFTAPVAARAGDSFFADYGELGTIAVHFS